MVDSVAAGITDLSADDIGRGGEHILIQDESASCTREPRTVTQRLQIKNRAHGTATDFTFYEEGFLRVAFEPAGEDARDVLLDLRFLDPKYRTWRRQGKGGLAMAVVGAAAASFSYLITPEPLSPTHFAALAAVSIAGAICGLLMFLYRWQERTEFATQHGRARVLSLVASFGCLGKFRRAAKLVEQAASAAIPASDRRDTRYYKEEMQAHYALRDRGTISTDVCAKATARILSAFG